MAKKKDGLFRKIVDLNGDGKINLWEKFVAYKIAKRCVKGIISYCDTHNNNSPADGELDLNVLNDDLWRSFCEDGSDYGLDPEDYETEEEYEEALDEAKDAEQEFCEDVDFDDFDAEEDE